MFEKHRWIAWTVYVLGVLLAVNAALAQDVLPRRLAEGESASAPALVAKTEAEAEAMDTISALLAEGKIDEAKAAAAQWNGDKELTTWISETLWKTTDPDEYAIALRALKDYYKSGKRISKAFDKFAVLENPIETVEQLDDALFLKARAMANGEMKTGKPNRSTPIAYTKILEHLADIPSTSPIIYLGGRRTWVPYHAKLYLDRPDVDVVLDGAYKTDRLKGQYARTYRDFQKGEWQKCIDDASVLTDGPGAPDTDEAVDLALYSNVFKMRAQIELGKTNEAKATAREIIAAGDSPWAKGAEIIANGGER